MKKIAILGSTGSIGTQTLDVVRANGDLEVVGISAGSNITLLEQQIREFHPKFAAVGDEVKAAELRDRVKDLPVKIGSGMDGMIELATMPESEILVTAIVGMIGIRPTVAAMKAGKDIALANKETLVTAGHIIMPLAEECGVQILPVDSEHSAIFQCLHGENRKEIEKLLITASGGPFRGKTRAELENVTVEQALRHPNWSMGHKITIDSATLVNKGLEVMEAKWLFGVDLDHIQVVVQPKSIIHSMVEFKDGAVMALFCFPHGQKIDNHLRHFVRFSRYCRIRLLLCRLCRFRRKRFDLRRCLHQLRHQLADRFQVKPLFLQFPDSQKNLNVLRSIAAVSQRIAVDFHAELVLPVPEHMRFLPGQLLRLRDQIRSIFHTAATPFFPLL